MTCNVSSNYRISPWGSLVHGNSDMFCTAAIFFQKFLLEIIGVSNTQENALV